MNTIKAGQTLTARRKTRMISRDQISKDAHGIAMGLTSLAEAAWNTPKEPILWGLVGKGEQLSNDACESRHTKKSLLKRLAEYREHAKIVQMKVL